MLSEALNMPIDAVKLNPDEAISEILGAEKLDCGFGGTLVVSREFEAVRFASTENLKFRGNFHKS